MPTTAEVQTTEVQTTEVQTTEVQPVQVDSTRQPSSTAEQTARGDNPLHAIASILPSIDDVSASMNRCVMATRDLAAETAGQVELFLNGHPTVAVLDGNTEIEVEVELEAAPLKTLSFIQPVGRQAVTEPKGELPAWVLEGAIAMGITDLAGVKQMDEGGKAFAYCTEDDCIPIRNLSEQTQERPIDIPVSGVVAPALEAPPAPAAPPVASVPAAAAPVQPPPPEEQKKTTIEIVNGKVGPVNNGMVVSVTLNGVSRRAVLLLTDNIVGKDISYGDGGYLGKLTRRMSSDQEVTLQLPNGFKGTLEEISPETLRQEREVAQKKAEELRLNEVKSLIKERTPALIEIKTDYKHLEYAKEAIELVFAQHKND